jgi:PDZ domain-containing secreted protein
MTDKIILKVTFPINEKGLVEWNDDFITPGAFKTALKNQGDMVIPFNHPELQVDEETIEYLTEKKDTVAVEFQIDGEKFVLTGKLKPLEQDQREAWIDQPGVWFVMGL